MTLNELITSSREINLHAVADAKEALQQFHDGRVTADELAGKLQETANTLIRSCVQVGGMAL